MLKAFQNLSIKWKLVFISMLTTSAVFLLAAAAIIADNRIQTRTTLVNDLSSLAQVTGSNTTSALAFNDPESAKMTLSSLKAKPNILGAAIYAKDGKIFATYMREDLKEFSFPSAPGFKGHRFENDRLALSKEIQLDREAIGAVYLVSDLKELSSSLKRYISIITLIFLISSFLNFILLSLLQRIISVPLHRLVKTVDYISTEKDFSVRVEKLYQDELGTLIDGFNAMLGQIQERDASLRKAHDELEDRVEERTFELKRRTEDLTRSNKELEQFAYVASHDLQEPLRMVASYVQLLSRRYKGKLDTDADDFINYAVDGTKRMQNLINDLLAYSRIGTKGKTIEPTPAEECLETALLNLQGTIEDNQAIVTHDPLPTVPADSTQLSQLLQNLIGNGIKYRKKEIRPEIHVSCEKKGEEWVFAVKDNGIGIDAQYFDRIFVIFQRLWNKEEYPGTGIGLSICKKIVERHGGRIWVESEPGAGSTFFFSLPVNPKENV